jgi:hypothetical protein
MEASGRLHSPSAVSPAPIGQETGWTLVRKIFLHIVRTDFGTYCVAPYLMGKKSKAFPVTGRGGL